MIRRAKPGDIPEIISLLHQVLDVHYNVRPDLFREGGTKYDPEQLEEIIKNKFTPVFVFTDDGDKAVGYAFCQLQDYERSGCIKPFRSLYIDDICVDEKSKRMGVATALFEYVKQYAKEIGCHNITLCVWEGNEPARRFYEKMGMGIQKTTMETVLD